MKRVGFVMKLIPGNEAEYKRRHDEIWPELSAELAARGIRDYTIYLHRETGMLFATQKLTENNTVDELPQTAIMKKWWAYMGDLMETNPDSSPVVIPLEEVFHAD